jgi:signal transduction histidine kinase
MRIRQKIFTGYLALVAVSVVLVVVFLFTLAHINRSYHDLVNRDQKVLLLANSLCYAVQHQMLAARSYDQFTDPAFLSEFESSVRDQDAAIEQISPLLSQAEDIQSIKDIQAARTSYTQLARQGIELAGANRQVELLSLQRTKGEPARVALDSKCQSFVQRENEETTVRQATLDMEAGESSTRLLLGAAIGVLAALLAATLLTEGLSSPLRRLVRKVQGIASGDLQSAIRSESNDEIGELAGVLETMRLKLAEAAAENERLLQSAHEEAEKLARARQDLESANAELAGALATESDARKRFEEINRLKDEFAGMVSHELKTPVSYVYNYAGALKEHNDSLNEGQRREFLTAIQSEALHLLTLIDDILAVSLLESGALNHRFVDTDLRQIIDNAVKDQQITTRRHTLTVKGPQSLPVRADPTRIKQVLNNLLSNAIKYSPQGGPVEVRLRANAAQGTALIYVRDHGIGIQQADVPKLFDRFTRIQRRETMAIPGSGLGLYIAHHIIQAHGGTLSLEPAPGKGTIAQVTISLAPGSVAGSEAEAAQRNEPDLATAGASRRDGRNGRPGG